ncbi:MAG TPA: ABC transporter permease [Haliscomenobacter sp.]|nr:ABC transporter permease [Haliscomenobacter sp.]HOY19254.1 ABC transporter permease [Haliscomenobacter sp.]
MAMLRSYLKIAWRNLLKNKTFSLINIFGLAVGLACFILIALYVVDELSYESFYPDAKRTYRVHSDIRFGGTDLDLATCSDPFGATLKKDYPEVEQFVRFYTNDGRKFIKRGTETIIENRVAHVDSTYFDVFPRTILTGNPETALNEPNTVAISESAAQKYFRSNDALGKTLEVGINEKIQYKVTAVYADMPVNSHFHFDFLFSMDNVTDYNFGNFLSHNFQTYVRLREGADPRALEAKFPELINRYVLPQASHMMEIKTIADFEKSGNKLAYTLMPVTDIHLHSDRMAELNVNGNVQYVYVFGIVALFLLTIACINFMNLSTARSANRAKEVGIRKVMGTERSTLMGQFMAESTLTSGLAFVFALLLAALALPYFNELAAKEFKLATFFQSRYLPFLLSLPLIVGVLAGYYPAFFLSSFRPIEVLKGKFNAGSAKSSFRNALVTVQFSISLLLIIATVIVYKQLNYIQSKNLGFNKDQVLVINATSGLQDNKDAFKNEVKQMAGVKAACYAGYLPVSNSSRSDNTFSKETVMGAETGFNMQIWNIDYDYIPTLGMEMAKGRNFASNFGGDSTGIILNETAANMLGYPDPIGQKLYTSDGNSSVQNIAYTIVGVVKNFHYESMRENVGPLAMRLGFNRWETAFRVNMSEAPNLIAQIESKWKELAPAMPFRYQFLDEAFDEMYRAEQRIGKVALCFAFLTILIACLGLFGLVTYMTEQRTKEIGIRKVLGASVAGITTLLAKDFLRLVLLAILIASPLAWYVMKQWLANFAFRINIEWWMFVGAGVLAVLIAFLTIGWQSMRAALANPIKSLRSE